MTKDPILLLIYTFVAFFFCYLIWRSLFRNTLEYSDRSINELYKLLYHHIKDKPYIDGLCLQISLLHTNNFISDRENTKLIRDFISQRPCKHRHSEFYNHDLYDKTLTSSYWWNYVSGADEESTLQRKKFIAKMIAVTK